MAGNTILGISPGTRYIGIAVLRSGELHDWRVKSYKGSWSDEKLNKVVTYIEKLVIDHVICQIACKVPHHSRTSQGVNAIIEKIKTIALEYKIRFETYSIDDLKNLFKMHFPNSYILSEHVTRKFPELTDIFLRERKNKHKYHIRVFEALAAGLHCHYSIS